MPENLLYAHERNDEVLERIYIGRRFRNDTERLEKLFELYIRMTASAKAKHPSLQPSGGTTSHSTKPASGQVAGYPRKRGEGVIAKTTRGKKA